MKKIFVVLALCCAFLAVSCGSGDSQKNTGEMNEACYPNKTCNEGLLCDEEKNLCIEDNTNQADDSDTLPEQTDIDTGNDADTAEQNDVDADADSDSADDSDTEPEENDDDADTDTLPDTDPSGCAYDRQGNTCTTDKECGSCMICAGAKCVRGCTNNNDCEAVLPNSGLKCNKKLARCVNIYGSNQACSETNCPIGCCYAKKGLSALRCEVNPNISTCGVCAQGKIYSPEDGGTCIPAVCSSIDDNCPSINAGATKPSCYVCKTSELICAKNNTSGCSSLTVVNTAQCVPAGQMCIEGVDNCCSGNPCVNGYCY